ncbi:MAG: hypothetical protein QXF56_05310 [Candidatus Micrarchaeia archaeon]
MKNKLLFIALLVVGCVFADIQITSYSVLPTTLKPGVTGSASITVYNPSSATVNGVVIYQGGEQFTFTSNRVQLGDIGPLGSTVVTIPFAIKNNVAPGVYTLRLDAFWTEGSEAKTKVFSIPISVSNPPIFKLEFSSIGEVAPGQSFTVKGQLRNDGGDAKKITLSVNSSYFFFDRISQLPIGDLGAGESIPIELSLVASTSVQPGLQSIPLTATYNDPLGATQQVTILITPVNVMKNYVDFAINAAAEKGVIPPGSKTKFLVNLTNIGNSNAYSAKVSISSTSTYFTSIGSYEKYFELLPPHSEKQIEFEIGVSGSAPAGYYPITITVNYLNMNGESQTPVQKQVGVEVGGVPQVSITPNTNPSPLTSGNLYTLSLQFSNTGDINIRALEATLSSDYFEILDSSHSYIGSLDVDDYTSTQFKIYSKPGLKPGSYPIKVQMRFKDAYNTEHTQTKEVLLEIVSPETAALTQKPAGMNPFALGIIVLAVLAVLYFAYKKYLKKKR